MTDIMVYPISSPMPIEYIKNRAWMKREGDLLLVCSPGGAISVFRELKSHD